MGENWESSGRRRDRNKHAVVFSQSRKRPDTFVPGAAPCSSLISKHFISVSITREKKDGGGAKGERERRHAATRWRAKSERAHRRGRATAETSGWWRPSPAGLRTRRGHPGETAAPWGDTLSTAQQGDRDHHWCRWHVEILCSYNIYRLSISRTAQIQITSK